MQSQEQVRITEVRKKVSGQGNQYYTLDVIETLSVKNESGNYIQRNWNNLYYAPTDLEQDVVGLKEKEVKLSLNFYPVSRKVGENEYNDVKCNVVAIESI